MSVAPDDPTTPFPPEESRPDIDPVETSTDAWLCPDCKATFTTSKRYHQRMLHQQSTTIVYEGRKRTVERSEDLAFHCLFCEEAFKDPDKLRACLTIISIDKNIIMTMQNHAPKCPNGVKALHGSPDVQ